MPKFNRISLSGSEELFRPTRAEEEAEDAAIAEQFSGHVVQPVRESSRAASRAPLARERNYVRLQLTDEQVKVLVEGVQRMKYPHMAAAAHQPSVEEFEGLEALRNVLLDAIE
jgi:hypothetical protein